MINLYRITQSDQGTEGILFYPEKFFSCYTLELPWRSNEPNYSCIPKGEYEVRIRLSPKYGRIYWVLKVPDRTYILIHSGNYAGDRKLGYKTHTWGCILLGKKKGWMHNQRAILSSRITLNEFMDLLDEDKFSLKIEEKY